jgi:group I intron endonuclease
MTPIKTYENPEAQKSLILRENKNKSIIYRWINKINNKEYIGSSSKAHLRLSKYFDQYILQNIKMSIYKAILKYGISNFILEIIEYCEARNVISREQFYLDNFDFEYNQLSKANSSLGFKHSEETLTKMKGRKNALGFKHTASTKKYLSLKSSSTKHSAESLSKMREL